MAQGLMATNTYYPSSAGMQLQGASMLSGFVMDDFDISMTVSKTPGTTPSYVLEALIVDADASFWVPVKNGSLDAVGNIVRRVRAAAVRINADNGTTPGEDADTPQYSLQAFPVQPRTYS